MIGTLRKMKRISRFGGLEFMPGPPLNYYEGVRGVHARATTELLRGGKRRVGEVLSDEQIRESQELGLLVDRDNQGVLIQISLKPIGDRY